MEKLMSLGNKLATSLLKEDTINPEGINEIFGEKEEIEILEALCNKEHQKNRILLSRVFDKSKRKQWKELKSRIQPKKKVMDLRRITSIAAIFTGIVGVVYFNTDRIWFEAVSQQVSLDKDLITLRLGNGNIEIVTSNDERKIVTQEGVAVASQKGEVLIYSNLKDSQDTNEALTYNELTVPYGKTFKLELSDGTQVYLNAGTTFKYPVAFIKTEHRQVFLDGEALFDVSKSKTHPFIVSTEDLNVRVLGTRFNVSSYKEDATTQTVLVEGSVGLYQKDEIFKETSATVLTPGKIASLNKRNKTIEIKEVDVEEYIAWTQGKLFFKIRPFSEIIEVLERHYDVSITNNYEKLNAQRFFAKFDIETIEEVLNSFQFSEAFEYEVNDNEIIITKAKQ